MIKPRVYLLGNENRQVVNKTFHKIHHLGHLKFITKHILSVFLIFIIWKPNAEGKKKGRAMIDIQKLNEMVLPNSYLLPLQSEIIANVQGCTNFTVLDVASFFYQ